MLISVIIPVYNKENYIEKCITSVINQKYKNIEIIIINDGSSDNSGNLIKNWLLKDDRIRYFEQKNQGVSSSRNNGVQYAKGKYIFFLDADDYLPEDALNNFYINIVEIEPDIAIGNYYERYDANIYKKSSHNTRLFDTKELDQLHTKIDMFVDNGRAMAMAGNKLYKTEFINKIAVKFQDNIISEDRLYNLICYVNNPKILLISDYTYIYNIIDNSRSRSVNPNYYFENISLFFSFYKYLKDNSKFKKYQVLLQLILMFDIYKIINYTFENAKNPTFETNKIINKMRENNLLFNTISDMFKEKKISKIKGQKLFNHMLMVSYLFLTCPRLIVAYKSVFSFSRNIKRKIQIKR